MIRLEAAGATDVGRRRSHNEDAFHVGESVFVLADGMGGHKAGEVASAAAVEALKMLDGRVFGAPEQATEALEQAVQAANRRVADMGADDSDFEGMGTTLTVAMGEGRRLHVAHVGDSRAYLFREGSLTQLTADHTLVQHLVDEGQITPAQAEHHPRRSVVTRAIGISADIEVDLLALDLVVGDVLVLCSDGLTDVVDDATIEAIVRDTATLQEGVDDLVELANLRGGPDNITVVALRAAAIEVDVEPHAAVSAGPNDTQPHLPVGSLERAATEHDMGTPQRPQPPPDAPVVEDPAPRDRSRGLRTGSVVLASVVLLVVVVLGGQLLLARSWYVGAVDGRVAIHQGVPSRIGPFDLSWVNETTDVMVADLPAIERDELDEGISATSLDDARRIVRRVEAIADARLPGNALLDERPSEATESDTTDSDTTSSEATTDEATDDGATP